MELKVQGSQSGVAFGYGYAYNPVDGCQPYEPYCQQSVEGETLLPTKFDVVASSGNPTSDRVRFRMGLPEASDVTFAVYDVLGRQVLDLSVGGRQSGSYTEEVDVSRLPSGAYVLHIQAGSERRMLPFIVAR